MKEKIMELFKEALEWDYDGSAYISEKNYEQSQIDFEAALDEILNESEPVDGE